MSAEEFLAAVEKGQMNDVVRLLNHGADINCAYLLRRTALHIACNKGKSDVASFLVERGANVNLTDYFGRTPLMSASSSNLLDVVKSLLDKGVKIDKVDERGKTALQYACDNGHSDLALLLIEKGANVKLCDYDGPSVLISAIQQQIRVDVIKSLLNKGPRIDECCLNGKTALQVACELKKSDAALLLIEKGADVNLTDAYGTTPLMKASGWNLVDVVKSLLDKGADVNARNNNSFTALHYATSNKTVASQNPKEGDIRGIGNVDIVRFLLSKGADYNAVDINGKTPLDLARETHMARADEIIYDKIRNDLAENIENLKEELRTLRLKLENEKLEATTRELELKEELRELKAEIRENKEDFKTQLTSLQAEVKRIISEKLLIDKNQLKSHMVEEDAAESGSTIMTSQSYCSDSSAAVAPQLLTMVEDNSQEPLQSILSTATNSSAQSQLNNNITQLNSKLNESEQEKLLDTLEIMGVEEKPNEILQSIVEALAGILGLPFPNDIVRVTRYSTVIPEAINKPRVILVKFRKIETAQAWLKAFREKRSTGILVSSLDKSFKDDKIYINQKLTHFNKKLLHRVKDFAKSNQYKFVWVQDGKILLRKNEDSPIIRIKSGNDIPSQ